MEIQGSIMRLIRDVRAELYAMLRIETEACSFLKVMDLLTVLSEGCISVKKNASTTSIFAERVMLWRLTKDL